MFQVQDTNSPNFESKWSDRDNLNEDIQRESRQVLIMKAIFNFNANSIGKYV